MHARGTVRGMPEPKPNKPNIVDCPSCDGSGERYGTVCRDCGGRGWFQTPIETR